MVHKQQHVEASDECHGHPRNNYLGSDHVLVFDNASTHLKRADGALSAHYMPKGIQEWGVETTLLGEDGNPVHG